MQVSRRSLCAHRVRAALIGFGVVAMATGMMLASVGALETPAQAAAGAGSSVFSGVASAEGFRFTYSVPGFVAVETPLDFGAPVSQAVVDGLGTSQAFASLPYPGDLAIVGPALAATLLGLPSPPPYPWYVATSHPTRPEATLSQGMVELSAKSDQLTSSASAQQGASGSGFGLGLARTTAAVTRDVSSEQVVAEATSTVDSINIGGTLKIGRVFGRAKATRSAGQEAQRESELVVEAANIGGQAVEFTDKGLKAGGQGGPLPDSGPLREALEQAGISVGYLAPQSTADGVISAGLKIRSEVQFPQAPKQIFNLVLGRASASATASGSGLPGGGGLVVEQSGGGFTEQPFPAPTVPEGPVAIGGTGGSVVLPRPGLPVAVPGGSGSLRSAGTEDLAGAGADSQGGGSSMASGGEVLAGSAPSPKGPMAGGATNVRPLASATVSSESVYLILGVGGVLVLIGVYLLRVFALRPGG